jgi:hypothetical protein
VACQMRRLHKGFTISDDFTVERFQLQMETFYMIVYPRRRCEGLATARTEKSLLWSRGARDRGSFEWFQLRMENVQMQL